jgi:hypothetical protein
MKTYHIYKKRFNQWRVNGQKHGVSRFNYVVFICDRRTAREKVVWGKALGGSIQQLTNYLEHGMQKDPTRLYCSRMGRRCGIFYWKNGVMKVTIVN